MDDIFISYSHDDSDWVREELIVNLETHGFSVFADYRDIRSGSLFLESIEAAVLGSRRVIAVLTPAYLLSEWGRLENVMAQTLDPGATQRRIVPVLRQDCVIPIRLRVLQYRDLRDDDPEEWARLIRDLM
jgi:hypothetical protein